MGVYVRHVSSLEHDPREHLAEHPDTPERIVAIERELAARGWLSFDVLDAPVVSNVALERIPRRLRTNGLPGARPCRDNRRTGRRRTGGGYDPPALADCVIVTLRALSGVGETESIAPDPILTSRAAAQFERYWRL